MMAQNITIPTWDELLDIMNDTATHLPEDIGWNIYRYLNANYESMASQEARMLLMCYLKLPTTRPSLLHSCFLSVAVKMAKRFDDFKFVSFLSYWGYKNLREEDFQQQKSKDGKSFPSLMEKVVQTYWSSCIRHVELDTSAPFRNIILQESQRIGFLMPMQMLATKMFETEHNGRKLRSIKLVAPDGQEMIADSHLFNMKPWEIVGKLYNVLPRIAKESGNIRVADIALSDRVVENVFGRVMGYVDRYDSSHNHYHIYDAQSRHFVAENPKIRLNAGDYVWFAPVVPNVDKFKSAIPIAKEEHAKGQQAFGIQQATIAYVNAEKDYFRYTLPGIAKTNETLAKEGFGTTSTFFSAPPSVGDNINIIVYLRRGKDGTKRNHIAEIIK